MSKKNKNALFNKKTTDEKSNTSSELSSVETLPEVIENPTFDDLVPSSEIEGLKTANSKLTAENAQLLERLAAYINHTSEKDDNNVDDLFKKIELLKNENDSYLMKISELTFENVQLQTRINELIENKDTENVPQFQVTCQQQKTSTNVCYNNIYKNNGYNSWN